MSSQQPIDMVLHCPACGLQHIDGVEDLPMAAPGSAAEGSAGWVNPPHRSHLCHGCGHIWRPADVPTNGVAAVKTAGKADSPIAARRDDVLLAGPIKEAVDYLRDCANSPVMAAKLEAAATGGQPVAFVYALDEDEGGGLGIVHKDTHESIRDLLPQCWPVYAAPPDDTALLRRALEAMEPVSAYGRVGSKDVEQGALQAAIAALRARLGDPK